MCSSDLEIAPRDFVFRSREFEQMEIEYFVNPEHWQEVFDELLAATHAFLAELGLKQKHMSERRSARSVVSGASRWSYRKSAPVPSTSATARRSQREHVA